MVPTDTATVMTEGSTGGYGNGGGAGGQVGGVMAADVMGGEAGVGGTVPSI